MNKNEVYSMKFLEYLENAIDNVGKEYYQYMEGNKICQSTERDFASALYHQLQNQLKQ